MKHRKLVDESYKFIKNDSPTVFRVPEDVTPIGLGPEAQGIRPELLVRTLLDGDEGDPDGVRRHGGRVPGQEVCQGQLEVVFLVLTIQISFHFCANHYYVRLFLTKLQKLKEKKTQDRKNSSQNLLKNSRYRNFSQFSIKINSTNTSKNSGCTLFFAGFFTTLA